MYIYMPAVLLFCISYTSTVTVFMKSRTLQVIRKGLLLCLFSGCFWWNANPACAQTYASQTPRVFAGMLDDRSRVLFVALDRSVWLAYDTDLGQLYKIWLGSLSDPALLAPSFLGEGPTIEGTELFRDGAELKWHIIRNGVETQPEVSYQGFRLSGNELILVYALDTVYGQRILVEERPQLFLDGNRPGIRRTFEAFNMPPEIRIGLDLRFSRLKDQSDLRVDGYFHRFSEKKHSYYWGSAIDVEGRMMIESGTPSSLTVVFSPNIINNTEESLLAESSPVAHLRPVGSQEFEGIQPLLRRRAGHEVGVSMKVYGIGEPIEALAELAPGQLPNSNQVVTEIDLTQRNQFGGLDFYFITNITGYLNIPASGFYAFKVIADDGVRLAIADTVLIEKNTIQAAEPSEVVRIYLNPGVHSITLDHFQSTGKKQLSVLWQAPWMDTFDVLGASVLSTRKEENRFSSTSRKYIKRPVLSDSLLAPAIKQEGQHPGVTVDVVALPGIEGVIGGIDVLSNGRLVVAAWQGIGRVYLVEGTLDDPEVKEIAAGLSYPLGLKVVDDELFVMQNHELTHLIDNDANESIDEFRVVSNNWDVSTDYTELAAGLDYQGGYFYGALGMPLDREGAILIEDVYQRGFLVRMGFDGEVEVMATGMQVPGGISMGVTGQLAIADQRNPWFSDSRVLFSDTVFDSDEQRPGSIWMPSEISGTPAQPFYLETGYYEGQWLVGDMLKPVLNRIFVDRVDGIIQGAVFPFSNGLPCEVHRVVATPDGAYLSGASAFKSPWAEVSKTDCLFQKITPVEESVFEIKSIRALPGGFDIEFTREVDPDKALNSENIILYQWPNSETQLDRTKKRGTISRLAIHRQELAEDGRTVRVFVEGLQQGHIIYVNLDSQLKSVSGETLWSSEAWYSLNKLP